MTVMLLSVFALIRLSYLTALIKIMLDYFIQYLTRAVKKFN